MDYTFLQVCAMFFAYAMLGWCAEVAFAAVCTGKFVNRGFLNGPVCPIYGFGVVIVVLCLTPVQHNTPLLFAGAVVLTSLLEYVTGFALEKIFHSRWWDYSDMPFNLSGYVCLKFSLLWGFACLLVMKLLHPTVMLLINHIPSVLLRVLVALMAVGIAADLAVTVLGIRRMQRRLSLLTRLTGELRELSDAMGEHISDNVLAAMDALVDARDAVEERKAEFDERKSVVEEESRQRLEALRQKRAEIRELLAQRSRMDSRILRAFPGLRSHLNQEALERLREKYFGGRD
ncbi:MAG: putative ABC transporter permease [Candidatus Heteroscillospira sp.]|jgi:uncharacterized membrane protein